MLRLRKSNRTRRRWGRSTGRAQDEQPRQRKPDAKHFSHGENQDNKAGQSHATRSGCGCRPPSMRPCRSEYIGSMSEWRPCAAPLVPDRATEPRAVVWWGELMVRSVSCSGCLSGAPRAEPKTVDPRFIAEKVAPVIVSVHLAIRVL